MSSAALVLAWLASLAPVLLERAGSLHLAAGEAAPRTALAALAWLAIAGMPRVRAAPFSPAAWWAGSMVCVPVLALCAALDLQAEALPARIAATALWSFAFIALSALAADTARRARPRRKLHAWIWTALFVGLPLFVTALRWGARSADAPPPAWSEFLAAASPLAWAHASIDGAATPYAPLAALVVLAALCALPAREEHP